MYYSLMGFVLRVQCRRIASQIRRFTRWVTEEFVNEFTFSGSMFYLYLAQDESKEPEDADESIRARDRNPAARPQFEQTFEHIQVQREYVSIRVLLEQRAAWQID